jgi:hypothetical protein
MDGDILCFQRCDLRSFCFACFITLLLLNENPKQICISLFTIRKDIDLDEYKLRTCMDYFR